MLHGRALAAGLVIGRNGGAWRRVSPVQKKDRWVSEKPMSPGGRPGMGALPPRLRRPHWDICRQKMRGASRPGGNAGGEVRAPRGDIWEQKMGGRGSTGWGWCGAGARANGGNCVGGLSAARGPVRTGHGERVVPGARADRSTPRGPAGRPEAGRRRPVRGNGAAGAGAPGQGQQRAGATAPPGQRARRTCWAWLIAMKSCAAAERGAPLRQTMPTRTTGRAPETSRLSIRSPSSDQGR